MIAAAIPLAGAGMVLSPMALVVKELYGFLVDINDGINKHIDSMKSSDNLTVARTGRVLEGAKLGFAIGYIAPVTIIAVGQLLLGNTLTAATTIGTAATLTNPIAMTCAAIGAIYYGWGALSDVERNEMLAKLSEGLAIGIELIKAMVRFVIETTKGLLDSKNFEEIKKYIGEAASVFGKTLSDVTRNLSDIVGDAFDDVKKVTGKVVTKTGDLAGKAMTKTGEVVDKASEVASSAYDTVKEAGVKVVGSAQETLGRLKTSDGVERLPESVEPVSPSAQSTSLENQVPTKAT